MQLSADFLAELQHDGFSQVGIFGVRDGKMYCEFSDAPALNADFSIYAFVGFTEGGEVMRIGKSHGPNISRLRSYPKDINNSLSRVLRENQCFNGGTTPWERNAWFKYLTSYGYGLLFVKIVDYAASEGNREVVLLSTENALIDKHQPPCCNIRSRTNKRLRQEWEATYGRVERISKRQPRN